jgi:hypothetical protein
MAATGAVPHVVAHPFGASLAMKARATGAEMRSLVTVAMRSPPRRLPAS